MGDIDRIIRTLEQIRIILQSCNETNWSSAIEKFISTISINTENDDLRIISRKIIGIYGGMGSFSDLVLYDDGEVCFLENEKLDLLRKELYELCKNIIVKQ